MADSNEIFSAIDNIKAGVEKVKSISREEQISLRNNKNVSKLTASEVLRIFTHLIAFSQNSKSKNVEKLINSGALEDVFEKFEIDKVAKMNPCDIADKHWVPPITAMRQQAKLFHIVSLARKLEKEASIVTILNENSIPKRIYNENDIEQFWLGFSNLQKLLKQNKVPFFQSTTSLLHFLLHIGYDCIKPDLIVMRISKEIGIVEDEKGDSNFIETVKMIQRYSIARSIRPSIVDLYFLIKGGQTSTDKYVDEGLTPQLSPD